MQDFLKQQATESSLDKPEPIAASVGDLLRLETINKELESLSPDQLLKAAKMLAQQAVVVQPASMRWLAREAATNLGECFLQPDLG